MNNTEQDKDSENYPNLTLIFGSTYKKELKIVKL